MSHGGRHWPRRGFGCGFGCVCVGEPFLRHVAPPPHHVAHRPLVLAAHAPEVLAAGQRVRGTRPCHPRDRLRGQCTMRSAAAVSGVAPGVMVVGEPMCSDGWSPVCARRTSTAGNGATGTAVGVPPRTRRQHRPAPSVPAARPPLYPRPPPTTHPGRGRQRGSDGREGLEVVLGLEAGRALDVQRHRRREPPIPTHTSTSTSTGQ